MRETDNIGGALLHYGNPRAEVRAAMEGDVVAELSIYAILKVDGGEARDFLYRMLTSPLANDDGRAEPSAWCRPDGRVSANLLLLRMEDRYLALLRRELARPIERELGRFVLRSDVRIEHADNEYVCIGIAGPGAGRNLQAVVRDIPQIPWEIVRGDGCAAIRLPGDPQRFLLVGAASWMKGPWHSWKKTCVPCAGEAWTRLDIRAGLAQIGVACRDLFLPQALNLDHLGSIDLEKGCFPGQEIIRRLTVRGGAPKRRLCRTYAPGTLAEGDRLYAPGIREAAGIVVNAAMEADTGSAALAVVKTETLGKPLHTQREPADPVKVEPIS